MRILCLILILVFFVSGLGCKKSQEKSTSTTEERGMEKSEKTPGLTDEEKDKLKSLGYVE